MASGLPPSYDQVALQRMDSYGGTGQYGSSVPLSNVDVWPRCLVQADKAKAAQFENFSGVLNLANDWLRDKPSCEVVCCETIRKKVYWTQDVYNGNCKFTPQSTTAVWVHGLRMWVRNGTSDRATVLAFADTVPQPGTNVEKYPVMEPMNLVVNRFNNQFQCRPLEGQIISIDTVTVSAGMNAKNGIDPLHTFYEDDYKKHRYFFLRVFYILGSPRQDMIGTADFVPALLKDKGFFKIYPDFEPLSGVMQRVQKWVSENRGIKVTNIQTIDGPFCKEEVHPTRVDTLRNSDYKIERDACRIFFIRVAYIIPSDGRGLSEYPLSPVCVPFVPVQTKRGDTCGKIAVYEFAPETVTKMAEWLHSSGAKVLCAETITVQEPTLCSHPEGANASEFTGEWYVVRRKNHTSYLRHQLLQIIRLYLERPVHSPPPNTQPLEPECCCTIL